ncbi:WD repeat-containing protein 93 [Anolis sagrei]|uniref:WD repeat-containing protein 93 n=1 Tax=Anolis sagrei TaxID=38937 RepID=UPI003522C894
MQPEPYHMLISNEIIFFSSIFSAFRISKFPVSKLLRTNKSKRRMSLFLRKQPQEIPSPTEKDWIKKYEEEDLFLKDPDERLNSLPQPLRMINKVLNLLFDRAWEIIEGKRPLQEIKQQNLALTVYHPSAELQVTGRANCLEVSGRYIFAGLSTGLSVFSSSTCEKLCAWEAANLEICTICVSGLSGSSCLLGAVDELGVAHLFYFVRENLLHIKAINEVEDITKRNVCATLQLSHRADYAGFLLQSSSEGWLEIYRLPKDAWLKELEIIQPVQLPGLPGSENDKLKEKEVKQPSPPERPGSRSGRRHSPKKKSVDIQSQVPEEMDLLQLLSKVESKLVPPVLLLKIRSPKPLAGSTFKNPFDALMKSDDGSVLGLGYNHMMKESQWEQLDAIFNNTFQQYLETEEEMEPKEEKPSHAVFHFHLPGRTLPLGAEIKAEPDISVALSVHWSGSHNLCFYLLSRPPKEKPDSDPKPDIVWPCAAPIACSAITPCSSYLVFACEDRSITSWDVSIGFPLSVTVLPKGYAVRSLQFMPLSLTSNKKLPIPNKVHILVLCTDGSLYLFTSGTQECDTQLLGYRPQAPSQMISAVGTIPTLPDAVLIFFWDGTVNLMDISMEENICQFVPPSPYKVASPWQPVFSVDSDGQGMILRGEAQSGNVKGETEVIFLFNFAFYPLMETFALKAKQSSDSLAYLPWDQRCDIFLNDNLQRLSTISQQMPECWSQLQDYAAALTRGSPEEEPGEEEAGVVEDPIG